MSSDGIRIVDYTPALNEACLALEAQCPQGESFRLRFRRREFHARAASYDRSEILVALAGERAVGAAAWAQKNVEWRGEPRKASFYFDARVHPGFRRQGIAQALMAEACSRADRAGADLRYVYCVDDNRASKALAALFGGQVSGRYRYLVWPCFRPMRAPRGKARDAAPQEVHAGYRRLRGPFDFYSDPFRGGKLQGQVASLMNGNLAGCSLWSNAGILEEVVERIPSYYEWLRRTLAAWPLRLRAWPHIPEPGEALRSWFAYDFQAPGPREALELMAHVNDRALESGIQFVYLVLPDPLPEWLPALQSASPRLFTPLIPYCLLTAGPGAGEARHAYVDVRDL